jgi:putative ABC transport system permease protein
VASLSHNTGCYVPILADLRYSAKSLARTPALTLALLLTIALGIGSNAAVFGFVRGLVARDVPLPDSDRLISLFAHDGRDTLGPVSYEQYLSLKSDVGTFQSLGAARESRDIVLVDGRPTTMSVAAISPELAELLQLPLRDGAVVSHRARSNEFGGKATVRGEPIRVAGVDTGVAGVAPEWLEGLYLGRVVDLWMPLQEDALHGPDRTTRTFWTVGRLQPGRSLRQAQAALEATRSGAGAIAALPYTGLGPEAARGMSRLATLLPAASAAVFVIACANVAGFLLSRASARAHETAVRVALGVTRRQLGRQLLADSLLLSIAGGGCGILLAFWTAGIIPALFFEEDAARLVFAPSAAGILTASAACAAITIACGLLPLVEVRDDDPAQVLRREGVGPSPAMQRVRAALVVAQMACCCLLVISTGLLLQGFRSALATGTGSRLGTAILATVQAQAGFSRPDLGLQYYRDAERAVLTLPGIYEAAWMGTPPGSRASWQSIRAEPPAVEVRTAVMRLVAFTPETLARIRMPPLAGRMFGGADAPQACRVAVVNQEAAEAFFDGRAVGRSIEDLAGRRVEIVGVVAGRTEAKAPETAAVPTIYYYAQQTGLTSDQNGPAAFRVPVYGKADVKGVLDANVVSRSYFAAMDVAPVAGRVFFDDPEPGDCRVGVVNEEAAELYFGGQAVGGAVIDDSGIRTTIVGVVHTVPLRATQRGSEPAIYLPFTQDFLRRMTLVLGARQADPATLAAVRRQLQTVGGGSPTIVTTLEAHLSRTALAAERIAAILVAASAATALALGVLGISAALADFTRRHRREIALRMALGAQRWRVMLQVVREGLRLAGLGVVAAALGSVPIARWLARITPEAGSAPLWIWLAAPLVLAVAVTIASVLPVGRALAVNPLTVMRDN